LLALSGLRGDLTLGSRIKRADFYQSFLDLLELKKDEELIADWRALPYDWRLDIRDIARNPITLGEDGVTSTYRMRDYIDDLAANSDSGKVTIVVHSTGGLIAKQIIKDMEASSTVDIIDQFVMVATPQLGTPKALASILHGIGQVLPGIGPDFINDILVSEETGRTIGRNSPAAYHLLPSQEYFNRVNDPIAEFVSNQSATTQLLTEAYGTQIFTFGDYEDFFLGVEGRIQPDPSDTQQPIRANGLLFPDADAFHTEFDNYSLPSNIQVTQIAGWGLDTIKGMIYGDECNDGVCTIFGEAIPTREGDQTVVFASATSTLDADDTYFVDLYNYNEFNEGFFGGDEERTHAKIMGTGDVLELLEQQFTRSVDDQNLPQFTTTARVGVEDLPEYLRLRMYSPVDFTITDSIGSSTGLIDNPSSTSTDRFVRAEITNSYYEEIGEVKYLGMPADDTYTIALEGTGTGTFTYEIDYVEGDEAVTTYAFEDVPVTPELVGTMTIDETAETIAPLLNLDNNGDGTIDQVLTPSTNGVPPTTTENIYLEAEYADSIEIQMEVFADTNASGGSYAEVPKDQGTNANKGKLTYTVDVEGGTYNLWARTIAPNGSDDSFFVKIDNEPYILWDVQQSQDWQWNQVRDRYQGQSNITLNLTAGTHTIEIREREDETQIDKLLLTNDLTITPSGTNDEANNTPTGTTTSHWLEAEGANTIKSPMVSKNDPDASNGAYIEVPKDQGTSANKGKATYQVTVDGGTYKLWGRTIAPNGSDDSFFVRINNQHYALWDVQQSSSWQWSKVRNRWNNQNPLTLNLPAGIHTIEIREREDETQLDKLLLTKDASLTPSGLGDGAENI